MLGAGAAATETLVKNLGQTTSAAVANLSNRDLSQAFTTGSTADAYELTKVKVQFGTVPGSTATVTAFIADGQGTSDDIIANLTNPPTWTTTSAFTAPDGITLDANTTYHLIIEGTEGTLATTASDSEDSGGASGWSIADAQTQRSMVSDSGLGGTWTIAINALKISVEGDHKGTVVGCSAASMEGQVWGATLTVGKRTAASIEFFGWEDLTDYAGASLTDDEFTFASDTYGVPWKGTVPQRVRIPPGKLSLQPVAIGADDGGNDIVRSTSVERVALGDPATMRAATRVNAEQASKPGMREPTRPYVGEGWHWPGSERQAHRLVPPGYWRRHAWKRGMGATREALSVVWHAPTGTP